MKLVYWTMALLAVIASAAVLALVVGAMLDPTSSSFAMIGALVWTTVGLHLLLLAVLGFVLALVARRSTRCLGGFALGLSGLSVIGATYITGAIVWATIAAGGSINPLAALLLDKMTVPAPNATETVTIVDGRELRAAIFLPVGVKEPAPVVAYIHGGGFMAGTNTETAADLRWFADRGWLVVSIDYRVFERDYPTWDKATPDAACGLAWVGQNAARLGGDPTQIALMGDSAGGNLAINIGFAAAEGKAVSGCGGGVPVPRAIAVQYPAVDPVLTYERGFPIPGFEPAMLMAGYVGGPPDQYPDRIAFIASDSYITPKAPPTLIVEPEKDSLVVSEGVYGFAERAKAAGVDLELVRIPFANHIYNQIAANSLGNQAGRTIRLRFLEQQIH